MPETIIMLCGGLAKRMRPLTEEIPKCMIPINGKPLLDYHLKFLRAAGIKKIILACGHKWEIIKKYYGEQFIYSAETDPLGTGGAVKKALQFVEEEKFFVYNADDIIDLNWREFGKVGADAIAVGHPRSTFGAVDLDKEGNVVGFREKPVTNFWSNAGAYLFSKKTPFPDLGSLEEGTFPKIKLQAFKHEGFWLQINTAKDIEEAQKFLRERGVF